MRSSGRPTYNPAHHVDILNMTWYYYNRKLQSARERLARLQALVSMVQQWPESAEVLPEDLAELAASAMDDDTASECASTVSKV